ncbi:ASNSD1 upstream open reading frame protein-like [Callorhinchus milii]|nr:ASNSD1 upstream open reading frame protein-like [Callorhinchus milii]
MRPSGGLGALCVWATLDAHGDRRRLVGVMEAAETRAAPGGEERETRDQATRRQELHNKIKEQNVAINELSNLKETRRVYKQQPNSNIFFLTDKTTALTECKRAFDELKKEHQDLENPDKMMK